MRRLILATAFSLAVTQANATGVGETLMEPEVLVQETQAAGSGGFIIPLLLLAIIAAVTTGGGTPGGPTGGGPPIKGCLGICPPTS